MRSHPFYGGKVHTAPKVPVRGVSDFSVWYTPGVAAPCRDIAAHPEKVWEHTDRGNTIAVISDCTRVLGLDDIGPEAGLPVMEGKALIFKYLVVHHSEFAYIASSGYHIHRGGRYEQAKVHC